MSKKLLAINVKGREKYWNFEFYGDTRFLDEWRKDGLEIEEIENVIPAWAVNAGLCRAWCFFQDLFNFKNPFK